MFYDIPKSEIVENTCLMLCIAVVVVVVWGETPRSCRQFPYYCGQKLLGQCVTMLLCHSAFAIGEMNK